MSFNLNYAYSIRRGGDTESTGRPWVRDHHDGRIDRRRGATLRVSPILQTIMYRFLLVVVVNFLYRFIFLYKRMSFPPQESESRLISRSAPHHRLQSHVFPLSAFLGHTASHEPSPLRMLSVIPVSVGASTAVDRGLDSQRSPSRSSCLGLSARNHVQAVGKRLRRQRCMKATAR
jgi:hypothetical protein